MKHLLRLAALLGLLILTGCPKPTPPTSDKLLHLAFDGSTYDSASHHYNVNATGTINYGEDRFGKKNGAIVLDGAAKIMIPNAQELEFNNSSSYSITAWVRTRDTSNATIISKGAQNAAVAGYSLQLRNGRPVAVFAGNADIIQVAATKSVADNRWHLLTLAVSPDSVLIYVDTNVVARSTAIGRSSQKAQGPVMVGRHSNGQGAIRSVVDDVIVWSKILNRSNVDDVFGGGGIITAAGLGDMPPGVTAPYQGILDVSWVSGKGFACGTGNIFCRTDNNGAWESPQTTIAPLPTGVIDFLRVSFLNPTHGALLDFQGNLYLSENGGSNWTKISLINGADKVINSIVYADLGRLFVVGEDYSGDGFIAEVDPANSTTQTAKNLVNIFVTPDCHYTAATLAGNATDGDLWILGSNGRIKRHSLTSTTSPVDVSPQPLQTDFIFQSADFTKTTTGTTGIVGTRDGRILEYSDGVWTGPTPSSATQNNWIIGVRDGSTRWAVTSGNQSGPGNSTSLKKLTSGWILHQGTIAQSVVVWTTGTNTYAIPVNQSSGSVYGLPGILIHSTGGQSR